MKKTTKKIFLQIAGIWLFLRTLTSLAAAAFSPMYPMTAIEKSLALWPPAHDLLSWLNRVLWLLGALGDAVWFAQILTHGYISGDGSTSFHPLYIWLSLPLYWLGVDSTLSLLIVSTCAALGFFWIFYRWALLDLEPATARTALLLLAIFPAAFILFAPYTESLFLLWAAITFYAIRQRRWGLAALASFLAALTRQQGVFLALPLAWEAWEASGKFKKNWVACLTTLAAPLGLILWSTYRIGILHEGSLSFSSLQEFIYSVLLSPSANRIVAGQAFRWPWDAFAIAVTQAFRTQELNAVVNLALGLGFLVIFILAWRYLNIASRLYSLFIVIVSFSMTTGEYAYVSLPRHLLLALPVFIGLAAALQKPWQKQLMFAIQILGYIFLIYCYVLNGWVP